MTKGNKITKESTPVESTPVESTPVAGKKKVGRPKKAEGSDADPKWYDHREGDSAEVAQKCAAAKTLLQLLRQVKTDISLLRAPAQKQKQAIEWDALRASLGI